MKRTHGDCWELVMHFRDYAEAKAVLNASSLDAERMTSILIRKCRE